MSQTEELRAELDRRKIKWWEDAWDSSHRTIFDGANGVRYCAYEFCGVLYLETKLPVTVGQAISATVGAGTCHIEECEHEREIACDLQDCDDGELWFTDVTYDCDECGYENIDPNIRFCGGCGRKVVGK